METQAELKSQGDAEGLEGHGRAAGGRNQGGGVSLADQGMDGRSEDSGGTGG